MRGTLPFPLVNVNDSNGDRRTDPIQCSTRSYLSNPPVPRVRLLLTTQTAHALALSLATYLLQFKRGGENFCCGEATVRRRWFREREGIREARYPVSVSVLVSTSPSGRDPLPWRCVRWHDSAETMSRIYSNSGEQAQSARRRPSSPLVFGDMFPVDETRELRSRHRRAQ